MNAVEYLTAERFLSNEQRDTIAEVARWGVGVEAIHSMSRRLYALLERRAEDERFLLPLAPHLGRESGPFAVMESEHEEIRRVLALTLEASAVQVPQAAADLAERVAGHCTVSLRSAQWQSPESS